MHTKRSHAFQIQIKRLIEKLRMGTLSSDERDDLITILQVNTTDSACLIKAAEDEPIFVLRGKDVLAETTVLHWAACVEEHAGTVTPKAKDARDCAIEMGQFPGRKFPD